jgi:hypothetical protein
MMEFFEIKAALPIAQRSAPLSQQSKTEKFITVNK